MSIIDKIEDLVFQSKALTSIEILKNRLIILKMRCDIEFLSETECHLHCSGGISYKIRGENLQIKEYGDTYVKVTGSRVTALSIEEGDAGE